MSDQTKNKEIPSDEEPVYKPSVINAQAINTALRTAQISIFIGFLLDGICGLYLYNLLKRSDADMIRIILLGVMIILGAILLVRGIARLLSVKSIGKYVSILKADERMNLTELARALHKNEQKVLKELENIFIREYLHGSLDTQTHSVTLTNK